MSERFERVLEIDAELAEECRWRGRAAAAVDASQAVPDLPTIRGLEAGLVAGRELPLRRWFYASEAWYYHTPATAHRLRVDRQFYDQVDIALRPLCRLALEAGLCTTPSCQGHFFGRGHYERIWPQIARERDAVKQGGLVVRDCENEQRYRWQDPAFTLPWTTFEQFHAEVAPFQNRGFMGIALPPAKQSLIEYLHRHKFEVGIGRVEFDDSLSAALGQPIVCATVDPRTPEERDLAWRDITEYFAAAFAATVVGA